MIKKLLMGLLSMVAALTWWTIKGDGRHHESLHAMPAKVWDGGGGTITLVVNSTTAGRASISFYEDKKKGRDLVAEEAVGAGAHSWSVEVPRNVGGYVEFNTDTPKVGDRISWTISKDGRRVLTDAIALDQPLEKGYVFALSQHFDDYSLARGGGDVVSSDDKDDD